MIAPTRLHNSHSNGTPHIVDNSALLDDDFAAETLYREAMIAPTRLHNSHSNGTTLSEEQLTATEEGAMEQEVGMTEYLGKPLPSAQQQPNQFAVQQISLKELMALRDLIVDVDFVQCSEIPAAERIQAMLNDANDAERTLLSEIARNTSMLAVRGEYGDPA